MRRMSTQRSTQDKGGKPDAGLENKALSPATEDKAAEPAKSDKVTVTLKAHYGEKVPGETVEVDARTAANLVREQYGTVEQ